jgi:hypothetical protein
MSDEPPMSDSPGSDTNPGPSTEGNAVEAVRTFIGLTGVISAASGLWLVLAGNTVLLKPMVFIANLPLVAIHLAMFFALRSRGALSKQRIWFHLLLWMPVLIALLALVVPGKGKWC